MGIKERLRSIQGEYQKKLADEEIRFRELQAEAIQQAGEEKQKRLKLLVDANNRLIEARIPELIEDIVGIIPDSEHGAYPDFEKGLVQRYPERYDEITLAVIWGKEKKSEVAGVMTCGDVQGYPRMGSAYVSLNWDERLVLGISAPINSRCIRVESMRKFSSVSADFEHRHLAKEFEKPKKSEYLSEAILSDEEWSDKAGLEQTVAEALFKAGVQIIDRNGA